MYLLYRFTLINPSQQIQNRIDNCAADCENSYWWRAARGVMQNTTRALR